MKNIIPPLTIGLDLGDKKHAICVLDQDGAVVDERTITNHRESLRRLSLKYPKARIASMGPVPAVSQNDIYANEHVSDEVASKFNSLNSQKIFCSI